VRILLNARTILKERYYNLVKKKILFGIVKNCHNKGEVKAKVVPVLH
jgi:hypothetical protein